MFEQPKALFKIADGYLELQRIEIIFIRRNIYKDMVLPKGEKPDPEDQAHLRLDLAFILLRPSRLPYLHCRLWHIAARWAYSGLLI